MKDAPRDGLRDGLRGAPRDLPHTTPHHTTNKTPSSRSMALAGRIESGYVKYLALVVWSLRPEWNVQMVESALLSDDRPWRTVVLASIRGAADPDIRHPNGLRHVNADGPHTTPRLPSVHEALNPELCDHEFRVGACPMCRRTT